MQNTDKKFQQFRFSNMRINNSPYVIVRGTQDQVLIKEGETQPGYKHNSAIDMSLTQSRAPFIIHANPVHENRFTMHDKFDKSTFLTVNKRATSVIPFERVNGRDPKLIEKGGDSLTVLKGRSDAYCSPDQTVKQLKRLDRSIPDLNKTTNRKIEFRSMYRQDRDLSPDHYDSVKIAQKELQQTKRKPVSLVDMKKASKRDFSAMLKTNAMYKNIQQDNARNEYIKRLLSEASADLENKDS